MRQASACGDVVLNVAPPRFHILSLCSGIGAFDLAVHAAVPGSKTVCLVERESFAAAILLARMEDAALEPAPVWCGDVEQFDGRPWAGSVDAIIAGFPCQPWSCAGQKKGVTDDRWIWPSIARVIREVEPSVVFLENVPGLISGGGIAPVLGSLASLGFDAEWSCLTASAVGASHKRERIFILAYRKGRGLGMLRQSSRQAGQLDRSGEAMAYSNDARRREQCRAVTVETQRDAVECGSLPLFAPGPQDKQWTDILSRCPWLAPAVKSGLHLLVDGDSLVLDQSRADQLRAIGNAVVPLQAAVAFRMLAARLEL